LRMRTACERKDSGTATICPVSLHANAVLLEVRRLPDPSYVARHAFRCNELCKDLSARLIREPGDDVGVITECHGLIVTTNSTRPSRRRQGGKTTHKLHPIQIPTRHDLEAHEQGCRRLLTAPWPWQIRAGFFTENEPQVVVRRSVPQNDRPAASARCLAARQRCLRIQQSNS